MLSVGFLRIPASRGEGRGLAVSTGEGRTAQSGRVPTGVPGGVTGAGPG